MHQSSAHHQPLWLSFSQARLSASQIIEHEWIAEVAPVRSTTKTPSIPPSDVTTELAPISSRAATHSCYCTGEGENLLWQACNLGHPECAQLLIAASAAIDLQDKDGVTPLYIACNQGRTECAQLLIAASAAIDLQDKDGVTPLYTACNLGRTECAQLLIAASAAIDLQDKDGATPLFTACNQGRTECAQLLIAASAAIDLQDKDGAHLCTPPAIWAVQSAHSC